jgi:hypothetical protein
MPGRDEENSRHSEVGLSILTENSLIVAISTTDDALAFSAAARLLMSEMSTPPGTERIEIYGPRRAAVVGTGIKFDIVYFSSNY